MNCHIIQSQLINDVSERSDHKGGSGSRSGGRYISSTDNQVFVCAQDKCNMLYLGLL